MPADAKPLSIQGWLMRGAIREDDWAGVSNPLCNVPGEPYPPEENLQRPGNHFYDPVHDLPLTAGVPLGEKAPDWALGTTNFLSISPPANANRTNHFTVLDAREAMYRALTGKQQDGKDIPVPAGSTPVSERNKYWATAFRALGDVVHLVEDMAQPQHTRNDAHFGKCFPSLTGHTSVYEKYIETRAASATFTTPGGQIVAPLPLNFGGYDTPRFTDYAAFFTTRNLHSDIRARQGLADYSNRGFFSAGKNLDPRPDVEYPYPNNNFPSYGQTEITTNWDGQPFGGSVMLLTNAVPDAYTGSIDAPVPLTTYGVWDQFLEEKNFLPRYTLNRYNYDAMADLLIPRAVAYSAGLIDYFFRGRLEAQDAAYTDTGLSLRIKNAIDPETQPYWQDETLAAGGTVTLAYQYKLGDQTRVGSTRSVAFAESLAPGKVTLNTYEFKLQDDAGVALIPRDATDVTYRVVYRGKIGQEQDALAVGEVEPRSGFLVRPVGGEAKLVYWTQGEWRTSPAPGVVAGNIDWKGWYDTNGNATKVLTWFGPEKRYFDESWWSFGYNIYEGGALLATTPLEVLGAAIVRDSADTDWLVAVCRDGTQDVIYRRPYDKNKSISPSDLTQWQEIGRFDANAQGTLGVGSTTMPSTPWFFSGNGREAQTIRRWGGRQSTIYERLRRLKLTIDPAVSTVSVVDADPGPGFTYTFENACVPDVYMRRASTGSGRYILAVDYDKDGEVVVWRQEQGGMDFSQTAGQTFSRVDHDIRNVVITRAGGERTIEYYYDVSEGTGPQAYSTGYGNHQREIRERNIQYAFDFRQNLHAYYHSHWVRKGTITDNVEALIEEWRETSNLESSPPSGNRPLDSLEHPPYAWTRTVTYIGPSIDCGPDSNGTSTETFYGSYETLPGSLGWRGTHAIDSRGRLAMSQPIFRDYGYEILPPVNILTGDDLDALFGGAAGANPVEFNEIRLIR